MQFCLPYFGSLLSIFLFPKVISYPWILTIHSLHIPLSIGLPWTDCCIFWTCKMLLGPQEKPIHIRLLLGILFWYLFSLYSKYFSSNVSRFELIPTSMIFRHNLTMDFWIFGEFLVKYEIAFFTRGNFIEGWSATASIDWNFNFIYFPIKNLPFLPNQWCLNNC